MEDFVYEGKDLPSRIADYYSLDLNIKKIFSEKMDLMLDLRNLLDRKNVKPGIWSNTQGVPEPGFSLLAKINYRFQ